MLIAIYSSREATGQYPQEPYYDTVPRWSAQMEALLAPHMKRLFGNVPDMLAAVPECIMLKYLSMMPLAGIAHWARLEPTVWYENDVVQVRRGGRQGDGCHSLQALECKCAY